MSFRKNPYQRKQKSPGVFFGIAPTELFQPTQTKRENDIAGGGGVESQRFQNFLLRIV